MCTPPSFKVDPLKSRLPLKVDQGYSFEFWQFWALFGLGRPRDQGGIASSDLFHPRCGFGPLLTGRSPLKVDRLQMFECLQCWAVFGLGRPRDQGGSLLWTRFTPSALVQRSADPNRTMFGSFWAYFAGNLYFSQFFLGVRGRTPAFSLGFWGVGVGNLHFSEVF